MPGERTPLKHLDMQLGGTPYGNLSGPVMTMKVKNNSGGALARGDVVITDWANSTKDLLAVTTSTAGTDLAVMGVIFDQSIAAGAIGKVQVWGPHDSINVDGTTDISIGDRLATFTTAKEAQKAASATGQPGVFATALAAFTTNGQGNIAGFITRINFAVQQ